MHLYGLSYVPEIIKTELTAEKTQELVARKYYGDLQLLLILFIVGRAPATTRSVIINRLTLGGFIDGFRDGISARRALATIQSLSSSTGLSTCYATSRCRYQLMHLGFPTRSTETQS